MVEKELEEQIFTEKTQTLQSTFSETEGLSKKRKLKLDDKMQAKLSKIITSIPDMQSDVTKRLSEDKEGKASPTLPPPNTSSSRLKEKEPEAELRQNSPQQAIQGSTRAERQLV